LDIFCGAFRTSLPDTSSLMAGDSECTDPILIIKLTQLNNLKPRDIAIIINPVTSSSNERIAAPLPEQKRTTENL
jgi:hypothetical protein